MLSSTALGVPRFSMTSDRRSSSTRRNSLPKLVRARSAETTIVSFLSVGSMGSNSSVHLSQNSTVESASVKLGFAACARGGRVVGGEEDAAWWWGSWRNLRQRGGGAWIAGHNGSYVLVFRPACGSVRHGSTHGHREHWRAVGGCATGDHCRGREGR